MNDRRHTPESAASIVAHRLTRVWTTRLFELDGDGLVVTYSTGQRFRSTATELG